MEQVQCITQDRILEKVILLRKGQVMANFKSTLFKVYSREKARLVTDELVAENREETLAGSVKGLNEVVSKALTSKEGLK